MIYKNKNFLIAGVSLSGFSSAKLLLSKGANVFLYDEKPTSNIDILLKMGAVDVSGFTVKDILKDIYLIVKSPGVPQENHVIEHALIRRIPVISEIELAWYNYRGTVLAVTGTNGKSTVTSLIDYILKTNGDNSNLCGNIGVPFSDFYQAPVESFCCVEVSSFQLENCFEFKPHICTVLNITEDHINRHHNMENYINAKKRILRNQKLTEYAVLNFDCMLTRQFFERASSDVYWFSGIQKVKGAYLENGMLKFCGDDIISVKELSLIGYHNLLNCLAAICFAKLLNINNAVIKKALATFKAIPHRLQYAGKSNSITFYNDSKATNTDSAIMAIRAMKPKTVVLIGGYDKGGSFKDFFKEIKGNKNIDCCVFFGDVKEKLISESQAVGLKNFTVCNQLQDSVCKAYEICSCNGTVLLSPACASFDEFDNFEQRGEKFLKIVRDIIDADQKNKK